MSNTTTLNNGWRYSGHVYLAVLRSTVDMIIYNFTYWRLTAQQAAFEDD